MNAKTTISGKNHQIYASPEITVVDILADSILCYSSSTETLVEDNFDPWA